MGKMDKKSEDPTPTTPKAKVMSDLRSTLDSKALLLNKVHQSKEACRIEDFETAVKLYSEAIELDPDNHILYSNRSGAFVKMGQFSKALQDAKKAGDINPEWPKAYYRQGVALQCLRKYAEALCAFSSGLAQDPKSLQLLECLVEAAFKSPLKASLEPTYQQVQAMKLDKSPFVILSVIGQELLAHGRYNHAVEVLENALKIGTCSLKMRTSVFSGLSSAHWALNNVDKAISYMQQDLALSKQLSDISGECRAHGNLGSAHFCKGNFKEALTSHRYQLVLAMKCKDSQAAAVALTSLGHVYTATGDYSNALASHKQCLELVQSRGNRLQEAREIGNVGSVHLALGDVDKAIEYHSEHLKIAKMLENKVEEARAYSNLGSSHHCKRNYDQAIVFHNHVLRLAEELKDKNIEARAYAGLGHAARCMGHNLQAKVWHEKQLDMALATKDKVAEGRACSNLGITYQLLGDHDAALKLHQAHLNIARTLRGRAGMGRAFGNIGNAYSSSGFYEQAIMYHKQELTISKEVNDRSSEASTHGNLAVAYHALGMHEMALVHYHSHLNLARELKDSAGEALALCNLGSCHSSHYEFTQAVPFYENYLMLSQELNDTEGEAKACHFLGYAHYCLGNYKEAIRYYDQDLALARDQQDKMNMGRAYCNLGLAHLSIGNYESALECQKYFFAIAQAMNHNQARFRALGNIGDVFNKMGNNEEAIEIYAKQLSLAKQIRDKGFEATAFGSLGISHRIIKQFDKALGFHTQELSILQDIGDMVGECKALGNVGAVHLSLGSFINAMKCYQEQLDRAKDIRGEPMLESQAQGNLGIAKIGLGRHEEAIACFEQQLAAIEQNLVSSSSTSLLLEKGRANGNLGTCYDALGDFEESVRCHEVYLSIALKCKSAKDQDRAYRELGSAHKKLGNFQQALVCLEKRLVAAHDLVEPSAKGFAYGELGDIHARLGNYEQAVSCLDRQLQLAQEMDLQYEVAVASSSMGVVYQKMANWESAMDCHRLDLQISEETNDEKGQVRALCNIGTVHESEENLEMARNTFEACLKLANSINDTDGKTEVLESLGRIHHSLGNLEDSLSYLQDGLLTAEATGKRVDEARLRHRMGMVFWQKRDLENAQLQLELAGSLFESLRRDAKGILSNYKLSLFDMQTECYQVLQRVLVLLGNENEALVVAERQRNRAFNDLMLDRQKMKSSLRSNKFEETPKSVEDIEALVNRRKASVVYYSIAVGYLFMWLIVPMKGIVKFHQVCISSEEDGGDSEVLQENIAGIGEALGIASTSTDVDNPTHHDEDEVRSSRLDALGDRLNQEGDKTGFLRMVNRGSKLNASSYSLSSLFSVGSVGGLSTVSGMTATGSRHGSTRSRRNHWQGPKCLKKLYKLLIHPLEEDLPELYPSELVIILEGDLYMVPFAMLQGALNPEPLCERYSILLTPSLTCLKLKNKSSKKEDEDQTASVIVGNPKLPYCLREQWGWNDIPYSEQEVNLIGEMLQNQPLVGEEASKMNVLNQLNQAECIHFSCHVSWKLSALVLSPGEFVESKTAPNAKRYSINSDTIHEEEDLRSEATSSFDTPALSEFLLTAADILNLKLNAKLVVISSCYTQDEHGEINSDGLIALTRSLMAAGAQCVLVSLWPVPISAVKVIMKAFYASLLQGVRVGRALADAMITVQNTKQLQHPANWAGFLLIGADIKLTNKVALMGQALREMLTTPETCRDALRVTLHLVEKSLQRILKGYKNAMYTSQQSIEKKIGDVMGWQELLMSVGFRFEPGTKDVPASVFFPQSDPGERLTQCSASLQALLGLTLSSWTAISKLIPSCSEADEVIALFRQASTEFSSNSSEVGTTLKVNVKVWRIPGCHELLASLGFDLIEVGKEDVILRTGKSGLKRQIQFTLQSLLALFETQDAPRSVEVDDEEESFEDEESESNEPDSPSDSYLYPTPRKSGLILDGQKGAFTSYVRNRGEPDGRQASNNDSPPHPAFPQVTIPPPPALATMTNISNYHSHTKGHESDCNFTPSPVDPFPRFYSSKGSGMQAPHSHAGPFTYGQQRSNQKNTYDYGTKHISEVDRSSSRGSSTDWNNMKTSMVHKLNGSNKDMPVQPSFNKPVQLDLSPFPSMPLYENSDYRYTSQQPAGKPILPIRSVFTDVGYGSTQKIFDKTDPNDKFSVRAEMSSFTMARQATKEVKITDMRLNPGVTKRMPPTGESVSPDSSMPNSMVESLPVTQGPTTPTDVSTANLDISNLVANFESLKTQENKSVPVSRRSTNDNINLDVYNERNMGLGMAPPLSSILMSSKVQVVQAECHSESEQSLNQSGEVQTADESLNGFDNVVPMQKKKINNLEVTTPKKIPVVPPKPKIDNIHAITRMPREYGGGKQKRDEGDGRSLTDSQYSGYSPNNQVPGVRPVVVNPKGVVPKQLSPPSFSPVYDNAPTKPDAGKQWKGSLKSFPEMENNKDIKLAEEAHPLANITRPSLKIWSRDQSGALQYTGMFSSDC